MQINSLLKQPPKTKMSANQTEPRAVRYYRLLVWFGQQQELAPINAIHHTILWQIYQFLLHNIDIWGSPDVQGLCVMGDSIVALYDRPIDVVDLTRTEVENEGEEDGQADDSRMAE
jgi:hypothetical protein